MHEKTHVLTTVTLPAGVDTYPKKCLIVKLRTVSRLFLIAHVSKDQGETIADRKSSVSSREQGAAGQVSIGRDEQFCDPALDLEASERTIKSTFRACQVYFSRHPTYTKVDISS